MSMDPGPHRPVRGYRGPLARMAGLAEALAETGLTMDDVRLAEVPVTRSDGYRATRALMNGPVPPPAIPALSDVLAYRAADALRELGVDCSARCR
jgi:DNA-binding LacI/PurR family transcriptional regulator